MNAGTAPRGWRWIAALSVLVCAAAVAVALHKRVPLANRWVPSLVEAYLPFEIDQLQFTTIDFDESRIARLQLHWRQQDRELTLELIGVRLRYRPLAGRIDALFVESARLHGDVRAFSNPAVADSSRSGFEPTLVPIGIDRLTIDVDTPHGPVDIEGRVSFDLRDNRFRATFNQPAYRIELLGPVDGGPLTVRLLEAGGGEPLLASRLQLDGQRLERLTGSAQLARLLGLLRRSGHFAPLVGRFDGIKLHSGPVEFALTQLTPLTLSLDGRIEGLTFNDYRVETDYRLRLTETDAGHRVTLKSTGGVRIEAAAGGDRGDIETMQLAPDPDVAFDVARDPNGRITLELSHAVPVRIKRVGLPPADARLTRLQLTADQHIDFDMRLGTVRVPDFGLAVSSLTTRGRALDGDLQGRSRIDGIRTSRLTGRLAPYGTDVDWRLQDGRFTASGQASATQWPTVEWRVESRGQRGEFNASWREPAARLTPLMRQLIVPLSDRFTLTSGDVTGELRIQWHGKRESSRLDVRIDDVGAELWGIALSSLSARLSSDDVLKGRLRVVAELKSAALGIGAELRDTRLQASGDPQRLDLEELSFKALDGKVRLRPTQLRFDDDRQELALEIEDIDLGLLLRTLDIGGLSGSGRLSGTIPLQIHGERWSIIDGNMRSLGPGQFSYRAGNGGPGLDNIALAALRDFRFDSLRLGVDYDTDGNYRVKARIVGRNPNVLDGRLLALNPNIEGRLPGLLLAILLGDFDAAMLERLTRDDADAADQPGPGTQSPGTDAGR